jgi:uncharacterized protein (TIGR02246 family)
MDQLQETAVRDLIAQIDAAWREKKFPGLEDCFHTDAVIVGPGYVPYATGREACAESYREFATNASVLAYSESGHALRIWDGTAVYTFRWDMTYQHESDQKRERGTDQLVLGKGADRWRVIFRFVYFEPA